MFFSFFAFAQKDVISVNEKICPHINFSKNKIEPNCLGYFYRRLISLEKNKDSVVRIYHIGDSHVQPDMMSCVIRNEFQKRFGNAGRGLLFPYALAKSDCPEDVKSSSNVSWRYNRVAKPKLGTNNGVAGFIVETTADSGCISLRLFGEDSVNGFQFVRSFQESALPVRWSINGLRQENKGKALYWYLNKPSRSLEICFSGNKDSVSFYGAEVNNGKPGVILNTIGVNGATFEQFNINPKFWSQLEQLDPGDLYIISLGSNEADYTHFDENDFIKTVHSFIDRIKKMAPNASILLTTVADYYIEGTQKSNPTTLTVNRCLDKVAKEQAYGFWDLLDICGGIGSAKDWIKCNLMSRDRVHFVKEGYQLQGKLLTQALIEGYRAFRP